MLGLLYIKYNTNQVRATCKSYKPHKIQVIKYKRITNDKNKKLVGDGYG